MLTLNKNHQIIIGLGLAALLVLTRGHHFASINHLPALLGPCSSWLAFICVQSGPSLLCWHWPVVWTWRR